MNRNTAMSMIAAASVLGSDLNTHNRGTTRSSKSRPTRYKQSILAGMRSKAHQFPDGEKLPNGKNRWYKKHGELVQRDV